MRTLPSLTAAYANGARAGETIDDVLAAIEPGDPAWITRVDDRALYARANVLDAIPLGQRATLPLFGIPFAVKDNIDVAGLPTTAGCPAFAYTPERSATVVERLERAGAMLIGKTNLDQFATGLVGTRSPYGIPVNPFNASYIPGGSSSGSAVAVARGQVSFALGTDTAGSGRVPAAFTATVGIKPTHGLISTAGVVPACRSLDCVSIFARTVDDARGVLRAAVAVDERDSFSRAAMPARTPIPSVFRFAVPSPAQCEFFGDDEARMSFTGTLVRLATLGGTAVEVDMDPYFEAADLLYNGPFIAERTAAVGDFVDAHPTDVLDITRSIIRAGRRFNAVDTFRAQYRIRALRAGVHSTLAGVSALVVPSTPTVYRLADVAAEPYACNSRLGTYTNFVNLLDLCAIAVPSGWYENGMPIGVTFIGLPFNDEPLAALAARFLELTGDAVRARPALSKRPGAANDNRDS